MVAISSRPPWDRMMWIHKNMEEIERWVLTWGVHATVVRPKALVDRLRQIGEEFCRRYPPAPATQ